MCIVATAAANSVVSLLYYLFFNKNNIFIYIYIYYVSVTSYAWLLLATSLLNLRVILPSPSSSSATAISWKVIIYIIIDIIFVLSFNQLLNKFNAHIPHTDHIASVVFLHNAAVAEGLVDSASSFPCDNLINVDRLIINHQIDILINFIQSASVN